MLKGLLKDDNKDKELINNIIERLDKLEKQHNNIDHKLDVIMSILYRQQDDEAQKIEQLEQDIIEALEGHGRLYIRELIKILDASNTNALYKALKQLERKGKITYTMEGRRKYILLNL